MAYIIFAASIVILIICGIISRSSNETDNLHTVKINGIDVQITDEELSEMKRKDIEEQKNIFMFEKERLIALIKADAECSEDLLRRKVLEELLRKKIENIDDLDYVEFLYNDGNLRTNEEVKDVETRIKYADHIKDYDTERHTVNFIAFFIPFFSTLAIVLFCFNKKTSITVVEFVISLVPAFIVGMIGMLIGYSTNIKNAKKYGIPDNDPRVQKEKLKQKVGVASSIAAGVSMTKSTKKAIKDISNVDSWDKMK